MKERLISLLLLFIFLISFVAAADVAYIYRRSLKIDDNILGVFSDEGLDVDLIDEDDLPMDFSDYRFNAFIFWHGYG